MLLLRKLLEPGGQVPAATLGNHDPCSRPQSWVNSVRTFFWVDSTGLAARRWSWGFERMSRGGFFESLSPTLGGEQDKFTGLGWF